MHKQIIVIAAVSQNGVYGQGGKIPWHIKEDFEHFKEKTTGNTVVMGRETWESLPVKFRPLPNRENIVVSRNSDYLAEGAVMVSSFNEAIQKANHEKVFCIGGVSIWYPAMEIAKEAWITLVKRNYGIETGITKTAHDLLRPFEHWHEFHLKDVRKSTMHEHDHNPPFEIQHWVR